MNNYENVRVMEEGSLCTLVLNRPKKYNALNSRVLADLDSALDAIKANQRIRSVVITGEGNKAFCAGADLDELENVEFPVAMNFLNRGQTVMNKISAMRIPVIAAVNGYALGGGMELALSCHLRIASETAHFGVPEVTLGMIPAFGGTQRLPRLIGLTHATELLLTGRRFSALEAQAIGLVNQVCPASECLTEATRIADTIAKNSPIAVEMILNTLRVGLDLPMERGLAMEQFAGATAAASSDQREGIRAFLNKSTPHFTGWETQGGDLKDEK